MEEEEMVNQTRVRLENEQDGLERAPMHLIEELRRYVEFVPRDAELLLELRESLEPHFGAIVESFYSALEDNPRTRAVFEDDAQLQRLRVSLAKWLGHLFGGVYDEEYYARCMHVGRVHVHVGLAPHFVSGAMNIIRRHIQEVVSEFEGDYLDHIAAVHKILDIELSLMLQSYWDNLLDQKLRVPQALASGLAHEIRNPLNSIGLNLTLLERRMRSIEGAEGFSPLIEVMRQEVRRIGSLTTEIMDFAKPIELQLGWVNAPMLLETLRALHEPTMNASNIELTLEQSGDPEIWCDRDRILQVLTNLLNNAAEAIEEGGHISISIHNEQAHTTIEVADDGKGMDPSLKHRVFELFFTDKITGTGLGLPIVGKIVDAHGGSVDLNTRPGRGTQFIIFLPREDRT
jgi:signal transduction histidine kinase